MNENARKWVEALRSEKYAQTTGQLRQGDGYCCLGVACDVYRLETGTGKWFEDRGSYVFDPGSDPRSGALPRPVLDWLGLRDHEGAYHDGSSLIDWNDSGEDFAYIAEIVESEPGGLFA